ncbi:MAG TPA: ferritin-like domain-containing protein [Jatrophihabitantaceae bacterium]|nr:ferritin-like domain-containing protein [Jatrophihabitantaceae bacterium]
MTSTPLIDAWQAALASEHQAFFGYGLLGPRLASAAERARARTMQQAHATLRDATQAALFATGQTPVAPLADYPALYPVSSPKAALDLAVRIETACSSAWRYLYSVAAVPGGDASVRTSAQQALIDSAVRATQWRLSAGVAASTVAFPGI